MLVQTVQRRLSTRAYYGGPSGPLRVRRDHPSVAGLLHLIEFNPWPRDLVVLGHAALASGTPNYRMRPQTGLNGLDYVFGSNPGANLYHTFDDAICRASIGSELTVMTAGDFYRPSNNTTSTVPIICNGQTTNTGYNWILRLPSQNTDTWGMFIKTAGAGTSANSTAPGVAAGESRPTVAAGRWDAANIRCFARNLDNYTGGWGSNVAKTGTLDTTDFDLVVGHWGTIFNTSQMSGLPWWVGVWNRALSTEEVEHFCDPDWLWSLFEPTVPRMYSVPAPAGGPPYPVPYLIPPHLADGRLLRM